ncbi:MAG: peptidoglycan binding protein CsiV [Gammaproteobacteria bacterium]|nr:peptidoglycan binding protein CsiV [Gammaproteobacteria bacterium]MCI0591706.1 peptidoglycan binding protein CsiV [Gammaproteobacteria bacterium]
MALTARIICLLICLLGAPVCAPGQISAEEDLWYQLELIVFEQLKPDANGESWPSNPGFPDLDGSIELISDVPEFLDADSQGSGQSAGPPVTVPMAFHPLQPSELGLADVEVLLKKSSRYNPIYQVAWRQPEFAPADARAVHVAATDIAPPSAGEVAVAPDQSVDEGKGLHSLSGFAPADSARVDGIVRLRKTKYLHVDVDLVYFLPEYLRHDAIAMGGTHLSSGAVLTDQQSMYVRLTESRKIRVNELHYFDHPLFGVLLKVTLYQPEGASP